MGRPLGTTSFPAPREQRGSPSMSLESAVYNPTKDKPIAEVVQIDRAKPTLPFLSGLFLLSPGPDVRGRSDPASERALLVLPGVRFGFDGDARDDGGRYFVQLRPHLFQHRDVASRLRQFSWAMAVATPLALVMMMAISIDLVPGSNLSLRSFCSARQLRPHSYFPESRSVWRLPGPTSRSDEYISLICWALPRGA